MRLENLLEKQKYVITRKWFDKVAETYPADTAAFIKNRKDPFANPVGNITHQALEALFSELIGGMNQETVRSFLDPLIRVRAVQTSFSPSRAVSFIFFLKAVIRETLHSELQQDSYQNELYGIESKIDDLSLIAFDIFMKCREQIYELKANEVRNRSFGALSRAGLLIEMPETDS